MHQFSYDPDLGVCFRTLDFIGFPGYRVGDDGSVWSCRNRGGAKGCCGNVVKLGVLWRKMVITGKEGIHLRVTLSDRKGHLIHRLVLLAFFGPCPPGMECCHFPDRDPHNNSLCNLRWDTPKGNHADRATHGTNGAGEKNGSAKIKEAETIVAIRTRHARGITYLELAADYDVSYFTIWDIVKRRSWRHIP